MVFRKSIEWHRCGNANQLLSYIGVYHNERLFAVYNELRSDEFS